MLVFVKRILSRWLLFLFVAWLPLQSVAGPLLAACCPDGDHAAHGAMHGGHPHSADAGDPGDAAPASGGSVDHELNPGHLCCPHFSAAASVRFRLPPAPAGFDAPAPALHTYTHFPEQPQRPPRA